MSILDTVQPGKVLYQIGAYDLPTADKYLEIARAEMKADWDMERPQMVADLLSQAATLQMEAREKGHLHIALGAINTAAKLAQIIS